MIFNFFIGKLLQEKALRNFKSKRLLLLGIFMNIGILGYFKYSDFLINNINNIFKTDFLLLKLSLPLAISFFTFQQIAYLVDCYRNETKEYNFLNYAVFISFFPQLIAGPIVHHNEMMPQFNDNKNKFINVKNISSGLYLLSIGLFKKIIIADTFAKWAIEGFDYASTLNFFESWITSLSYTFQLYFDFSGYTDMAIGIALFFNIKLPINFNSPYKAKNIQDFWRRWHITLSRFLRDYLYIPLGGNKLGEFRTLGNLMSTFIIGGIWHGAGWTFILWGFLHGLGLVFFKLWNKLGIKFSDWISWLFTFNFLNITWVFFRANTLDDAIRVIKGMTGISGISLPIFFQSKFIFLSNYGIKFESWLSNIGGDYLTIFWLLFGFIFVLFFKNSIEKTNKFKPTLINSIFVILMLSSSFLSLGKFSEFLYFNF